MSFLQKLGKSLMLPVTIMPLAALLKGIGYWIDPIGWGVNNPFAAFLILSGGVVIDHPSYPFCDCCRNRYDG